MGDVDWAPRVTTMRGFHRLGILVVGGIKQNPRPLEVIRDKTERMLFRKVGKTLPLQSDKRLCDVHGSPLGRKGISERLLRSIYRICYYGSRHNSPVYQPIFGKTRRNPGNTCNLGNDFTAHGHNVRL